MIIGLPGLAGEPDQEVVDGVIAQEITRRGGWFLRARLDLIEELGGDGQNFLVPLAPPQK